MRTETVVVTWRVRDSLLAYMQADPSFSVDIEGEAAFSPETGVRLPARRFPDGRIVADGGVTLRAHDGALTLALTDLRIEDGAVWIRDPQDAGSLLRLVTVRPAADRGEAAFDTELAPEADLLFMYNYAPGVPFGLLSVEPVG
jgi:hypothetical protein